MLVAAVALAAEDPVVTLTWKAGRGRVAVEAPPGEHVAPDSPATLKVGELDAALRGDPGVLAFPLAAGPVEVETSFALCVDGGTSCRPVTARAKGFVTGKAGSLAIAVARAEAVATGGGAVAKVLDFAAVWCPPCNLMAAEVLHDPLPWPVETVDVDQKASWALKARYAVGGYPTLVAVDAEGREVARLVGYPGEEATRAWFAGLATVTPLHALDCAKLSPKDAAAAARRLAEGEKEAEARACLAGAEDGVDARVARLALDGDRAAAEWLVAHAPPGPWLVAALDAAPDLWPGASPMLAHLDPVDAADAFAVVAEHLDLPQQRLAYAAALALLESTLTGEPDRDRGHVTFLADLHAELGELDEAIALLDRYAAQYPDEFTFEFAASRLLLDAGRAPEAERRARVALAKAWGDQKLRAVERLAKAMAAQGKKAEAVKEIDAVLASAERPAADVAVRTHRYVKVLEELRAELQKGP
ncbi:MAG: tetratricopeptide repeat protein [Myxococcota bacterium]